MQIPSDEAFIRRSVQRKAAGKTRDQVAGETHGARDRQQASAYDPEAAQDPDTLRKAEWKHAEWRRIGSVMAQESMETYDPGHDPMVQQWAREREQRAADSQLRRQEAERARQQSADELHLFVWLQGAASRRLQALAAHHGVSVEALMTQLATNVQVGEDGDISVPPFTPTRTDEGS